MQWHQLNHMQTICTSLHTDNHTNTSSLNFLQAGRSSWWPTDSVKALKAIASTVTVHVYHWLFWNYVSVSRPTLLPVRGTEARLKFPWVEFRSIGIGVRVSISFTYDWHDLGSTHIFRRLAKNAEPEATATYQRRPLLSAFSGCRQRRGQSLRKWQQPASDKPCRGRLGARNHGKSSLLVVQIPTHRWLV